MLTVIGDIQSPPDSGLISGNIAISFRDSGEIALILPFRVKLKKDVDAWPMAVDVELSEDQCAFARVLVSNLETTDELSFRDQNNRIVEHVAEPAGSDAWLIKLKLEGEPKSTIVRLRIGDFDALKGDTILVDWEALNL